MEPTVLIIGAGTFGTSAAHHLAHSYKDASRVTVIDLSESPSKEAASIDINRIIRTDYPSELYCNLAFEAIHDWFWSIHLGHFFHKTGRLMLDEKGSTLSERIHKVFEDRGSTQTEDVQLEEVGKRWDALKGTATDGFASAYYNPEAGWVDAAGATASFMQAAEKRGIRRVTGHVTELLFDTDAGRIKGVRTADGQTLTADKIVLATGAWTSLLLSPIEETLGIPEEDSIERQVQATGRVSAYYKLSAEELERPSTSRIPVFVYGRQGEVVPPSNQNKVLKYNNSEIGLINSQKTKSGRKISVPPTDWSQASVPETIKRETEAIMTSKVIPDFCHGRNADSWRICWDAQTPTDDFLLCKHPHLKLSNLYLAVGGSFHSYKFMPNIGRYLLNVLGDKSNGLEKDKAWSWKSGAEWEDERKKRTQRKELKEFDGGSSKFIAQAKL